MPDSQTDLVTKAQLGLQAPENQVFEPQKLVEMFFFFGWFFRIHGDWYIFTLLYIWHIDLMVCR